MPVFLYVDDERLSAREDEKVCAAVPAGSVVLMHNRTPHVSYVNATDHVRWSLDLRYQGGDVTNNVDREPEHAFDGEIINVACYPPEADFVLQDLQNPAREVRDPIEFARIRDRYDSRHRRVRGPERWVR